jgi:hypothetical protein
MVRALMAGTKTQTRRAVKREALQWLVRDKFAPAFVADPANHLSPYGYAGDRLWVREAWARTMVFPGTEMVVYREGDIRTDYGGPWKPGIHLFRRDSRTTLTVTGLRIERLQDISEADALAEGIVQLRDGGFGLPAGEFYHATDPRISYWSLWEHINGAGSVEENPWVWVVEWPALLNTN